MSPDTILLQFLTELWRQKLTFDVEQSCGRAAACRAACLAVVLALVCRSGANNRQHGAPRTELSIVYKVKVEFRQTSQALILCEQCSCAYIIAPDLVMLGYWISSTQWARLAVHRRSLGTWSWLTPLGARWQSWAPLWRQQPGQPLHTKKGLATTHTNARARTCRTRLWTFRQDWVKYSVNEQQPQSKQPEQTHGLNRRASDDGAKKKWNSLKVFSKTSCQQHQNHTILKTFITILLLR